ncbi:MAG: head-tail connector protein [Methyloceanibacter sp.]
MALVLTEAPEVEPISLAEAKAHLRVDSDDEDMLIEQLIVTARMFIERALGLALITQTWSYFIDTWPRSFTVALPLTPVQAVSAVKLHDAEGGTTTLDEVAYAVDVLSQPARVVLTGAVPTVTLRALNAFEVLLLAGYGDEKEEVPETLRHALVLLVAHWFERREPVVLGSTPQEVPATVAGLLLPYRRVRL